MSLTFCTESILDLDELARKVIQSLGDTRVICLIGTMGAGKTTFVKSMLRQLETSDLGSSPTYSLINAYITKKKETIYHLDLYRLNHEEEALDIGIEEIIDGKTWCFIEWPELIMSFLPEKYAVITINSDEQGLRNFTIELKD
jgi:tRNA threonylcarbamoyladenosine biosynthesis protein TsaE